MSDETQTMGSLGTIVFIIMSIVGLVILLGFGFRKKENLTAESLRSFIISEVFENESGKYLELTFTGKLLGKPFPTKISKDDIDIYIIDLDHPDGDFIKYEHKKDFYSTLDTISIKVPDSYIDYYIMYKGGLVQSQVALR